MRHKNLGCEDRDTRVIADEDWSCSQSNLITIAELDVLRRKVADGDVDWPDHAPKILPGLKITSPFHNSVIFADWLVILHANPKP